MADFDTLREQISQAIKENNAGEITGQVLQDVLTAIVDKVEEVTGKTPQFWINENQYLAVGTSDEEAEGEGTIANVDLSTLFSNATSGSTSTAYEITLTIAGTEKKVSLYSATTTSAGLMSAEAAKKLEAFDVAYNEGYYGKALARGLTISPGAITETKNIVNNGYATSALGIDMYFPYPLNLWLYGEAGVTEYFVAYSSSAGWQGHHLGEDFFANGTTVANIDGLSGLSELTDDRVATIVSYDKETHKITLSKSLNPDEDWTDSYKERAVIFTKYNSPYPGIVFGGGTSKGAQVLLGTECSSASDNSEGIALGCRLVAHSTVNLPFAIFGYMNHVRNGCEFASGRLNKSHYASSSFGNAGNTLFSIGIGNSSGAQPDIILNEKNAVEVMQNGDMYVYGIGGYDGADIESHETLQEVITKLQSKITDLETRLAALEE